MSNNQNNPIRVAFFGTHTFACTIISALIASPAIELVCVVTKPDQPVGRKKILTPPPAKLLAEQHHIPVYQPASLKTWECPHEVDLGVTAQYGKLVPEHLLSLGTQAIMLNVHTSLLPAYRGASPIQSALLDGATTTGVTIMQMEAGLDTGPILMQESYDIAPDMTYPMLDQALATVAAPLLLNAITGYVEGTVVPVAQDDTQATHCSKIAREDGQVDWTQPGQTIYNAYRAYTPWPGIFTFWQNKRLKLLEITPTDRTDISAGTMLIEDHALFIGTATTALQINTVQLEGKSAMDINTFILGYGGQINTNPTLLV
jgi:methionyl-tRNA formyltransferase